MSTRAMYTFFGADKYESTHNVYKHHDGYPTGAAEALMNTLKHSWQLPRYESDDFAAAFVAGNKPSIADKLKEHLSYPSTKADAKTARAEGRYAEFLVEQRARIMWSLGGGIRLMKTGNWKRVAPYDLEYRYEIHGPKKGETDVSVTAFQINFGQDEKWEETKLFMSGLAHMDVQAKLWEVENR